MPWSDTGMRWVGESLRLLQWKLLDSGWRSQERYLCFKCCTERLMSRSRSRMLDVESTIMLQQCLQIRGQWSFKRYLWVRLRILRVLQKLRLLQWLVPIRVNDVLRFVCSTLCRVSHWCPTLGRVGHRLLTLRCTLHPSRWLLYRFDLQTVWDITNMLVNQVRLEVLPMTALAPLNAYKIGTFLPNSPVNYVQFLAFDSQNAHVL